MEAPKVSKLLDIFRGISKNTKEAVEEHPTAAAVAVAAIAMAIGFGLGQFAGSRKARSRT